MVTHEKSNIVFAVRTTVGQERNVSILITNRAKTNKIPIKGSQDIQQRAAFLDDVIGAVPVFPRALRFAPAGLLKPVHDAMLAPKTSSLMHWHPQMPA